MSLMQAARPLDPWRWIGWPALACVLATVLFAVPIRAFSLQPPQPVFPMIVAFAWAVIRPSVLAPFVLLLLGLLLDLYWDGPLGLWAVSLLAPYAAVLFSRTVMTGQGGVARAVTYVAGTGLAMLVAYLLSALDALTAPNPFAVFWQFLATCLLYPFAHGLIERFEDADVRFR
jgi:rod shape-determining protein MreD